MAKTSESQRELKSLIEKQISACRGEIVEFTKALVAVKTENPPGNHYRECAEVIAGKLQEMEIEHQIIEVPRSSEVTRRHSASVQRAAGKTAEDARSHPRYCVLGSHGEGERTLCFHGHYDVVPAHEEEQFHPRLRGGDLFGRGSSDMKGGLAAMVYAVKALKECRQPLSGRIGLTFVADEETGGALGSRYLAEAGLLGKDGIGMLTAEPTSGAIWNASRGALSLRVTVRGRSAHVGLHYQGVNAFEGMMAVAQALAQPKTQVESRKTGFKIAPEEARGSILLMGGRCEGGTNFNVVPDECSFTVDRRINPEESLEEEKDRLFALFDRLKAQGIDIDVEILQEGESAGVSEKNPLATALSRSVREVSGRAPSFQMCPGLLETRFYAARGIPALAYGPGLLAVSHGPDEYVKVADVYACAVVYALTAARVLAV